jgi:hypothetical protein
VKGKPARAAAIISKAIEFKIKDFPYNDDRDMQTHVEHVYGVLEEKHGVQAFDIANQIRRVNAPAASGYKAIREKYGQVSAKLVEKFCLAERNVTEDPRPMRHRRYGQA